MGRGVLGIRHWPRVVIDLRRKEPGAPPPPELEEGVFVYDDVIFDDAWCSTPLVVGEPALLEVLGMLEVA